jgi:hypothetical protein
VTNQTRWKPARGGVTIDDLLYFSKRYGSGC